MQTSEGYVAAEDGARMFFQTLGSGPKTVLIPNGIYLLDDFKRLCDGRTLIAYDPRNRGRSDRSVDGEQLKGDILLDIEDLEKVRRHFGIDRLDLIGHSYVGLMVALYGMTFPDCVNRIVQIGPMEPRAGKQYPTHLTGADAVMGEVFGKLGQMHKERGSEDPVEFANKMWSVLRLIYIVNPADAARLDCWARFELPNELNFLAYWTRNLLPSIQSLQFPPEEVAKATGPVLTIHGTKDRSAAYGGGREWAMMLPNARLVTVENAAHAPWIESPERVFGAIDTFFGGAWPEGAEKVEVLDPLAAV